MSYARVVNTVTGEMKDVGRFEAKRIIRRAERTAIKAMKKYEGEVVLYGFVHKDMPNGMEIRIGTPSVHSKNYIINAFHGNKHTEPLFVLRKTKR